MARQAIRNEGKPAELAFLKLVNNSRGSDSAKRGDAIVSVDGIDRYVEIKYVTSNTVNQIRAIKFIPLVIFSPQEEDRWAVLPAQEVVRAVLQKERGQHTEIAFESANLSLNGIDEKFRCRDEELGAAVYNAIRAATKYSTLGAILPELLQSIRSLNDGFRKRIEDALREGDAAS